MILVKYHYFTSSCPVFWAPLAEESFSIVYSCLLYCRLIDCQCVGLFLEFLICSTDLCLFLCQYHTSLITVALKLLGCILKGYKAYDCPDSKPKKEPRVSHRHMNSLFASKLLHVWSTVLEGRYAMCVYGWWWTGLVGRLSSSEEEKFTSYRENWVRFLHWLPGRRACPSLRFWWAINGDVLI